MKIVLSVSNRLRLSILAVAILALFALEATDIFLHDLVTGFSDEEKREPGETRVLLAEKATGANWHRSLFDSPKIYNEKPIRFWIASASHGEDTYFAASRVFPNLICAYIVEPIANCLNASRAGYTIEDNKRVLRLFATPWSPTHVILYQAFTDVVGLSKFEEGVEREGPNQRPTLGVRLTAGLGEWIETTQLYRDVREFVGSSLLLNAELPDGLNKRDLNIYRQTVEDFVSEVRAVGADPVLVTFAAKYSDTDEHVKFRDKTWMLIYSDRLSPHGLINALSQANDVLRDVAAAEGIKLVDLDQKLVRNPEFFRDFVHFSASGHEQVARIVVEQLAK